MNKLLKSFTLSFLCFCTLFFLSSCSSFFGSDSEGILIQSISTKTLENGDIEVTISYTDEEKKPTTFIVPRGENGESGTGIKEVLTKQKEDGTGTVLTITYTNNAIQPTTFEVKDGVSLSKIETLYDEETTDTYMVVHFSDGTMSEPLLLPKGEKGKDGISVLGIEQRINRDYSVTLTFLMSEGDDVIVEIPAPIQGEDGKGIEEIISIPRNDNYMMIITYTDGTTQELEFARPNKWFSESATPTVADGINGDLWYDLSHNIIYVKQSNRWVRVIDLNQITGETYTVRFDLNDSASDMASMPVGSLLTYEIPSGHYFEASGYEIPIPIRTGYTFKGWYTVKNPTVVHGAFTDLTAVFSDITLYAKWEKVN